MDAAAHYSLTALACIDSPTLARTSSNAVGALLSCLIACARACIADARAETDALCCPRCHAECDERRAATETSARAHTPTFVLVTACTLALGIALYYRRSTSATRKSRYE